MKSGSFQFSYGFSYDFPTVQEFSYGFPMDCLGGLTFVPPKSLWKSLSIWLVVAWDNFLLEVMELPRSRKLFKAQKSQQFHVVFSADNTYIYIYSYILILYIYKNRESRIENRGSRIEDRESRIENGACEAGSEIYIYIYLWWIFWK